MIITTTDKVMGYEIEKYLGIVEGTDIYLVGGLIGGGLSNQEGLFHQAKMIATDHMERRALDMHADAIIGVSYMFTSPGGLNDMILVAYGTAVKLRDDEITAAKKAKLAEEQEERERVERQQIEQRKIDEQNKCNEACKPIIEQYGDGIEKSLYILFSKNPRVTWGIFEVQNQLAGDCGVTYEITQLMEAIRHLADMKLIHDGGGEYSLEKKI